MLSPVRASDVPDRTRKAYRRSYVWVAVYATAAILTAAALLVPRWSFDRHLSAPAWEISRVADGKVWLRWWPGRPNQQSYDDSWYVGIPYVLSVDDCGTRDRAGYIRTHGDQISLVVYLWWPTTLAWIFLIRSLTVCMTLRSRLRLFLCRNCGYDLRGAVDERCSECGSPFVRRPT